MPFYVEERDVKLMCLDRAHVWREGYQRFRPQFSKMSDGENPSVQLEEDCGHLLVYPLCVLPLRHCLIN